MENLYIINFILNLKKIIQKNTKKSFQCLCTPVILINSIYRKNKNYYPIVFLDIEIIVVILMRTFTY